MSTQAGIVVARRLTDRAGILSVLETDRVYAAYAIGDLQARFFEQCQWAVAQGRNGPVALVMAFAGLQPPALFTLGSAEGIRSILRQELRPAQAYVTVRPENLDVVSAVYRLAEPRKMWRMTVDEDSFRPVQRPTLRLRPSDIGALNELYSWGGAAFFAAYQLDQGVYHAVVENGKLVAAAGTHIVAPEYGVAAVGNVYTHPDHRSRGHATACTSAVVAELLTMGCRTVVLSVRQDNAPAIYAYEKLGFRVHCPFLEMAGQRRQDLGGFLRRLIGRKENVP